MIFAPLSLMMTNLFIPAQLAQLDDATLERLIRDYDSYLLAIPAPTGPGGDPRAGLRVRLVEAIDRIEEELMERRGMAVLEAAESLAVAA